MSKIIRIANGQGFWGDSLQAPIDLIKKSNIDYLTLDYLAEVTMSIMQKQKNKNPKLGYAYDFVDFIELVANHLKNKEVKIITNAGGVNPYECAKQIKKTLDNLNISKKIAVIEGDNITSDIKDYFNNGIDFISMEDNTSIKPILDRIYSANVYIDSFCIKEALKLGADIVLCGRVSDPGLCVGPTLYEFNWTKTDYNKIASATLAGHIIECGAQATGGNHTNWKTIPNLKNVGYPIAEIKENGDFYITKDLNTGGIVNKQTVCEQILYEMGDPKKYISPDVCVDFTTFKIKESEKNKVFISEVKGSAPTDTLKVAVNYFNGYKAVGQLTISGPSAYEKARYTAELIWSRLKDLDCTFQKFNTEYLGLSSCTKDILPAPNRINEIVLRLSVIDNDRMKVKRFGEEIAPVITNGPPGITGFSGGRPKPQEVISYFPTLIDRDLIKTKIQII